MNTIGGYFVNRENDSVSIKENMIIGKKYRFTVLTERLIRLEYSPKGVFEDRATQRVIYRKFPKVNFKVAQSELLLQVITSYFTLDYVKEKSFVGGKFTPSSNLRITLNQTDRVWYYNHPEARNFGGITYSLDDFKGNLKLDKGLYSNDGFSVLDDSDALVLNSSGDFLAREDKEIDIYIFMYRKDFGLCLQDYYALTGYPFMIPRYALGAWWYKNTKYNKEMLSFLLSKFKEEKTPLSACLVSGKWYSDGDPLNFDKSMLDENALKELTNKYGVRAGIEIDPSMRVCSGSLTYENISKDVSELKHKEYSFLPFSKESLNLYCNYGIRNLINMGIDSFVINYNNVKDKSNIAIASHACYALSSMFLNRRSVVFARNHGFAVHRNTIVFTGRTRVDWNTLGVLPRYNATASNNGISYVANAIGGYYGGIENFELYIRYLQFGVFSSLLLLASDDGKYYKREPWRFNVAENAIIKKYLNLRNKLIPYLYTESYIYHKNGSPIVQPLYYKYPKIYDEPLYKNQYFFGSQMLVCPITKKKNSVMNRVVQRMFIPEGIWYEFESGKKYLGNKYYMSFYKDEDYPVFCKEGAIIPLSLDEDINLPLNMEVVIVPGCDGHYDLYEDDGVSNNFKNGSFVITEFDFKYQNNRYELGVKVSGNLGLVPQSRNYKFRFKNTKQPTVISILSGNNSLTGNYYLEGNDLIVEVLDVSINGELKIQCSDDNAIEKSTIRLINDDIKGILEDLEIETVLKEKIDAILFSDLSIKKKRIAIRKLKKDNLEPKFVKMFLNLLEYIKTV